MSEDSAPSARLSRSLNSRLLSARARLSRRYKVPRTAFRWRWVTCVYCSNGVQVNVALSFLPRRRPRSIQHGTVFWPAVVTSSFLSPLPSSRPRVGENRIEVLAEVWDHFFTETLPTLQAIFYPVQGQELTIRQISLLGFRDLVLLKVKLGDLLLLAQSRLPSSIVQMLLVLQSVHEPTGPSEGYLQLEELVKQVVSPFLGISEDRGVSGPTFTLARRHSRVRPKVTLLNYASPMTTVSRPLNEMALTPLTEQEGEAYLEKCGSVRRHTVANAHSDIQLLAMATRMHSGLGEEPGSEDKRLLLPPSFPPPHRQCSSEPNITDSPDELEEGAGGSQEDSELNCASLS
ncbi:hypothetical protein HPG69_007362 [Diceros bicornis minor]|uniref:Proline-rich protein 5-like n=1 Tax=Diceros bicornis minor TaxID=77932 RepID=A0A7J7EKV5_DICBM|nr:hypothetical protein HPG69_007362 [Diceros bicornis minor]